MEPIAGIVGNFGAMVAVVAAVVYYLPKAIGKLLEQRDADAAWLREEVRRRRQEYMEALRVNQTEYVVALKEVTTAHERSEERWRTVIEEITGEIKALRDEVRNGARHAT